MKRSEGACLICGAPLVYFQEAREMECSLCHRKFPSNAQCEEGHFICDECHSKRGIEVVMEGCRKTPSKNPIAILQSLMEDPFVYMHGPEHHVMVGAALLAAYRNAGGELDLEQALAEMAQRGQQVPGGACGFWGCCGAAVSTGIFVSIVTGSSPLSGKSWGLCNEMTSRALASLAAVGGPRCCKRNSFLATIEAVKFAREKLGVSMELPEKIQCAFVPENQQCLRKKCPFNPLHQG